MLSWISLGVGLLALSVNALTFIDRRRQDRRDMFLKMHERLIEPQLQEGRRVIYERCSSVEQIAALRSGDPEAYQLANRALAMLDALGIYVARGYVDRGLVMQEWARSISNLYGNAGPFLEFRGGELGSEAWPNFQRLCEQSILWLAERADKDIAREI